MLFAQRAYPDRPGLVPPTGGTLAAARPQIKPNRQELNDRFPMLGFTISTGDLPYFEVLLTTDRGLFDPAQAERRNATNFYSSRQDSGFLQAQGGSAVYLVPPAVLSSFVSAQPRPEAIYYTLVAYRDDQGADPAFAMAPSELPQGAPSVRLSADFQGQSLAVVMGTRTEMLRRVAAAAQAGRDSMPPPLSAVGLEEEPGEDQDAYYQAPPASLDAAPSQEADWPAQPDQPGPDAAHYFQSAPPPTTSSATPPSATPSPPPSPAPPSPAPSPAPPSPAPPSPLRDSESTAPAEAYADEFDLDYDDGFGPLEPPARELEDQAPAMEAAPPAQPATEPPLALPEDYDEAPEQDLEPDEPYDTAGDEPAAAQPAAATYEPALEAAGQDTEPAYQPLDQEAGWAQEDTAQPRPLSIEDRKRTIDHVARFESGRDRYAAINADGEFEGRFGTDHPAYQRYHIGLSYGLIQFTQDSGSLGKLLRAMKARDQEAFSRIFGPEAEELLRVTNAEGPGSAQSPGGRSARVQPVGGADLWTEPWLGRFRQAAEHLPFQAAQYQTASELYLDPVLPYAGWMGLNSERALAMLLDRCVHMGVGGGRSWFNQAVSPLQSPTAREQALQTLGHSRLEEFQRATPGLSVDNVWGPMSEAAATAALRALGSRSPIQIPSLDQMLDAVVRRAEGTGWASRVRTLRTSTDIPDTLYQLA